MKKIIFVLLIFCAIFHFSHTYALESDEFDKIYNEQLEESGADKLKNELPDETTKSLENIGGNKIDLKSLLNITPKKIFDEILRIFLQSAPTPFRAAISIFAIIFLCSLIEGIKPSVYKNRYKGIMPIVGALYVCVALIIPSLKFLNRTTGVIKGSASFMLSYIPVFSGIILSSGQPISANYYQLLMISLAEVISQIASHVMIPILSSFLAVSVVSSISSRLDISGISNIFHKAIKWILGLSMTIFTGVLSLQNVLATTADGAGKKALKFMVSNFVPVIGRALSDGILAVQGSLKILKSSVGVFVIIACGFIFLPILFECILWIFSLQLCVAVSTVFNIRGISKLLENTVKLFSLIFSIVICCVVILIVSTTIMLTSSG
jgi:stage III sporulation protein AE